MARFRFHLESVLQVRKRHQDVALRELAMAQRAYQAEIAAKIALIEKLKESLQRREELAQEPVSVSPFHIEEFFIVGLRQQIARADQKIFRARKNVEKAMKNYLDTRKKTRALEVLKEKKLEEHKKLQSKIEQRELDDLVVMRHGREAHND